MLGLDSHAFRDLINRRYVTTFWLGSDDQGRDMLSAILYGLRISLGVGVISTVVALAIGLAMGLTAAYAGGRVYFVRAEEIDWIESAGNYVKLHVGNDTHLLRETMTAIEAQLDPEAFFRIHRCHIVNIERVRELQPSFNGEYVVFLKNGARLTLSRG